MNQSSIFHLFAGHWLIRYIILPLSAAYLVLLLVGVGLVNSLLFPESNSGHASYQDSAEYIKLRTTDGLNITARYLANANAAYTILYSHGNGEDLGLLAGQLTDLRDMGFAVLAYDYHGYGTSQGDANESNAYRDIDAAYVYLTQELLIPPRRVIVYGYSVGGGPSVDLAARRSVGGLILQSTFISAFRKVTYYPVLPFDQFNNIKKISRIRCPVLVVHGQSDVVIPFSQGVALYRAAKEPKQCLWVSTAGHNDLVEIASGEYRRSLQEFISLVASQNPASR